MTTLFDIMEIQPPRFCLELSSLERKFHELSKRLHPDTRGGSSEAVAESADLNGAYRRLRDPWKRALYLLEIYQIPLGSKVPPCLAPTYFELQESNDRDALIALQGDLHKGQKLRLHQLEETFKRFDQLNLKEFSMPPSEETKKVLTLVQELVLENNYALSMLRDLEKKLGVI